MQAIRMEHDYVLMCSLWKRKQTLYHVVVHDGSTLLEEHCDRESTVFSGPMEIRLVPFLEPIVGKKHSDLKLLGSVPCYRKYGTTREERKVYQPIQFSVHILGMPILLGNQSWQ